MPTAPADRKLVIVTPSFHGYYEAFENAFQAAGFRTQTIRYDGFTTVLSKARNKLELELPELLGRDRSAERARRLSEPVIAALRAAKPDLLLVIKGDALSDAFWESVEELRVPYVVWFYDEMRRMGFTRERVASFPKIATYSALDAQEIAGRGLTVQHIANGFDTFTPYRERGDRSEVTFIGAAYPNRIAVMEQLHRDGVKVRAYGRTWSHDLRDRARTWNSPRPAIPAERDVSRADAYGLMKGSLANINSHFNQDGFTMRTFEAPGVGGIHLIDRPDVAEIYEVGREVLVYESHEELLDHIGRVRRDAAWANRMREAGRARTEAEHTMVHRAHRMAEFFDV